MDFAYDIDPGPDLLVGEFDQPCRPWGARLPLGRGWLRLGVLTC